MPGAASVRIGVSKKAILMTISATGALGTSEVRFMRESEAFRHFKCSNQAEWTYQLSAVESGMRALSVANETFIRINADGILCIQHQVGSQALQRRVGVFIQMLSRLTLAFA